MTSQLDDISTSAQVRDCFLQATARVYFNGTPVGADKLPGFSRLPAPGDSALFLDLDDGLLEAALLRIGQSKSHKPKACSVSFYVEPSSEIKSQWEAAGTIYDMTAEHCFFQLNGFGNALARYQQIAGSRKLSELSGEDLDLVMAGLASLWVEAMTAYTNGGAPTATNPSPRGASRDPVQEELSLLKVSGGKILLPERHLSCYAQIKAKIEKAGGRYSRGAFVFPKGIDAAAALEALQSGSQPNPKKESQSFFSPPQVVERVYRKIPDVRGKRILEPSAGQAALADEARARGAAEVVVVENHPPNIAVLKDKGYSVIERDFLTITPEELGYFDIVVANPPFTRDADIAHIRHMWQFVATGGQLVTVASLSAKTCRSARQRSFMDFLGEIGADVEDIEPGLFKSSGTSVGAMLITATKKLVVNAATPMPVEQQTLPMGETQKSN